MKRHPGRHILQTNDLFRFMKSPTSSQARLFRLKPEKGNPSSQSVIQPASRNAACMHDNPHLPKFSTTLFRPCPLNKQPSASIPPLDQHATSLSLSLSLSPHTNTTKPACPADSFIAYLISPHLPTPYPNPRQIISNFCRQTKIHTAPTDRPTNQPHILENKRTWTMSTHETI